MDVFQDTCIGEKKTGLYMNNAFYEQDRVISPRRFVNCCVLASTERNNSYYFVELPQ